MNLKEFVYSNIKDIAELNTVENFQNLLINTIDSALGDISLPCFTYAKALRKSPMQIATEFAELCKCENFSDVQAVNGYVNFYVNKEVFTKTVLNDALTQGVNYGKQNIGENIVVLIEALTLTMKILLRLNIKKELLSLLIISNTLLVFASISPFIMKDPPIAIIFSQAKYSASVMPVFSAIYNLILIF